MLSLSIPGRGDFMLYHTVFDVNGTLAVDGRLIEGVAGRLDTLSEHLEVHLLTADTHGRQASIDAELGLVSRLITPGNEARQKADFVEQLDREHVVAIGNGANDAEMLRIAAVSIAIMGPEGLSIDALQAAQIIAPSILDALDMLLSPQRLIATLRC
ncbi:MAG: HAD hydrolase family protein [Anaerolineae bacterium]|nr:HAD hydrolase family protein [Anaerolineae bacterium]